MPGPWSTTRTTTRGPTSRERTRTGCPSPWTTAFSSRLAKARSSWVGSALSVGRSASSASRTGSPRAPSESRAASSSPGRSTGSRCGSRVAGLQARDVEQVLDQAREPLALLDHRLAQLVALLGAGAGRVERGAGGDDRGQRRAQVVGDRAQQRGLQLVAAPQRLGLDRLRLHPVALARPAPPALASARSASSRRRSASAARARAQLGQGAADDRDDREDDQRDEICSAAIVERAQRRQVEEVEGGGAEQGGQQPQPQSPDVEISRTPGDVDDPERDRWGDVLQRVDEQSRRGDHAQRAPQCRARPKGARRSDRERIDASLPAYAAWTAYSYCSDSSTSSREARRAGKIAATTPSTAATTRSTISDPTG